MDNMYKKIEVLCKDRGLKISQMCLDIGIKSGVITDLKKGRTKYLSAPAIQRICIYFDVSADYILGLSENKKPLSADGTKGKILNEIEKILDELPDNKKIKAADILRTVFSAQ